MIPFSPSINARLLAKGLKRSVVLGQLASSTSHMSKQKTAAKKRPPVKAANFSERASKAKKKRTSSPPKQSELDRSSFDYGRQVEMNASPLRKILLYYPYVSSFRQILKVIKKSHQFELSQNEALRKELDEEKKKSCHLEMELSRLQSINSDQASEFNVGTSSARDAELVPLKDLLSLEDLIERKLEKALNRFPL